MRKPKRQVSDEITQQVIARFAKRLGTPHGRAEFQARIEKDQMKKKLRDAERFVVGKKGSAKAQAGLPSLGKRRP